MKRHRIILPVLAIAALAACTTDESLPQVEMEDAPAPQERRVGSLLAEYRAGGDGTSVHAQFLDVQGVSVEAALEALEIWRPDRQLDIDACSVRAPLSTSDDTETVRLDLLDVGPITVRGAKRRTVRLEGRRLPDLMGSLSGVVYGNEQGYDFEEAFIPYAPGAYYTFSAPGTDAAGDFDVTMSAPNPPEIYAAAGDFLIDDRDAALALEDDLAFAWTLSEGASGSELYLDVSADTGPDQPRLRCHLEDDGHFTIPATILEQVAGESSRLDLTLRRVHASDVDIDGLETSEFIFASTDAITINVE